MSLHESIPLKHIALILDGNGRWAQTRGLPITAGHRAGAENLRQIVKDVTDLGIPFLTVYAFSTENWTRSGVEIKGMMQIFRYTLKKYLKELSSQNVRLRIIGDMGRFPKDIQKSVHHLTEKTRNNTGLTLSIALNYGSRAEITQAVCGIAKDVVENQINLEDIGPETLDSYLYTQGIPDPDLLVRPGGEMRLSNFLLWQLCYTELIFSPIMWPDFNRAELEKCIEIYKSRQRRFGRRPLLEEEEQNYLSRFEEDSVEDNEPN